MMREATRCGGEAGGSEAVVLPEDYNLNEIVMSVITVLIKKLLETTCLKVSLLSILIMMGCAVSGTAQEQVLEFTAGDGNPTSTDLGPIYEVPIRFLNNTNNPGGNNFDSYLPETTATIRIINPNTAYDHAQNTDPNNLFSINPVLVAGWNFDDDPSLFEPNGEPFEYFRLLEVLSTNGAGTLVPNSSDYTSIASNTAGTGIDTGVNRGVQIVAGFEGLRDEPVNGRYRLADMEIEFNRPVDNPVLHITGLGAFWFVVFETEEGDLIDRYENTASVELDLTAVDSESFTGFNRLSGTSDGGNDIFLIQSGPNPTDNKILNGASSPNDIDPGVAHGSVEVQGTGINKLTFEVYAEGTANPDPCGFGWAGDSETWFFTDGSGNCNTNDQVGEVYSFAQDAWILSISSQVQPDEVELTEGESFRMLSSPVQNTSYRELLGDLWIQGDNVTNTDSGDPNDLQPGTPNGISNIYTWNLGLDNTNPWNSTLNVATNIPAGEGFLFTVFEDDDFSGTIEAGEQFPKTLTVTGSEPTPPIINDGGGDEEGWLLLGNPFKEPIDISQIFFNASNTGSVVYVWDRGTNTEPAKGYRASTVAPGDPTFLGEIDNGVIMPFQGFFIQRLNNTSAAEVDFTDRDGLTTTTQGTFYRKDHENQINNVVRLEVSGESLSNYLWLTFSDYSTMERQPNDALELTPLTDRYTLMSTKKSDGVLLTIGQFPVPDENFEIPVSIESTDPGIYTVKATDFNLSLPYDLYFIDTEEERSIRMDKNFSYDFYVNQAAKSTPASPEMRVPKVAKSQFADRFLIATQPKEFRSELPSEVALNQNYPNPFNPTTQITYQLPQQSDVRLQVFDMTGKQVATLVNESMNAGTHTVNFDASELSSGVYLYKLQAETTVLSRKLTLIK